MKQKINIYVCIIVIILSSCSSEANSINPLSISSPDIGVAIQSENYLEVTAPNGWNTFKTDGTISLMIRNISDKRIVSQQDFGAKIFIFTTDKWNEVENRTVYLNDQITLDPNKNFDPTKIVSLFIRPDLPDYSKSSYLRIFVVGRVLNNGQKQAEIATFIDLELHP